MSWNSSLSLSSTQLGEIRQLTSWTEFELEAKILKFEQNVQKFLKISIFFENFGQNDLQLEL